MLLAAVASQLHYRQFRDEQQQHALLLQAVKHGARQIRSESFSLLTDSASLSNIQTQQDHNIVDFQHITKGSLKQDLAPLDTLIDINLDGLSTAFNQFSAQVFNLIQSRSTLTKLSDKKEEQVLAARTLAEKSSNLARGVMQYGASDSQVGASYEVALALTNHYLNVSRVFEHGGRYNPLDLDSLRESLGTITSGKGASDSAILRRSATNLMESIEAFSKSTGAVTEYEKLQQSVARQLSQLEETQKQLEQSIDAVSETLNTSGSLSFILSFIAWVSSVTAALCGIPILLKGTAANANKGPARPEPEPASEVTGSFFINQIRTDKNKLINDIRPLADGILYIKADEHHESTADVARCFNHSRESLIVKVEALRDTVSSLQNAVSSKEQAEHHPKTLKINSTPLEDLTFKAQAELEGISRRIKAQASESNDSRKLILTQCIRADNILDEIRVRIRKGCLEITQETNAPNGREDNAYQSRIENLVNQLIEHLDEFQTQPPAKRNKRVG
ncbi:MAG: hypothetical protein CMK89_23780 [Pseudomonadales bacterium]|nr:hypothetical protein [Pseudomonadales bacterium]